MQNVIEGYKGIGLLFEVNNDRILSVLIILVALAAVGWVGVEYANSVIVEQTVQTSGSII
jgi:hypothetical protein